MPRPETRTHDSRITVTVRLFAGVRERARTSSVRVQLPPGSTVRDALEAAPREVPGTWWMPPTAMLAVNGEYAGPDKALENGDELGVIPPVSGGSGTEDHFIEITSDPLSEEKLVGHVSSSRDGAIVVFHGITRDHNEGRKVLYLEYEAYGPMAERKMAEVIGEMKSKWEIGRVAVVHRTGRVEIGQTSMILAVAAPHRRPAFEAALYFVDRLKQVVPIWKKEYFVGGEVWIGESPGR